MSRDLSVLGIETSCDETAAAVVQGGRRILSNVVSSQVEIHQAYSGVVPELASRAHVETIQAVVEAAVKRLAERNTAPFPKTLPVDAVAVTVGPGLMGSLLVGKTAAEILAWTYRKPLIPVNHLEGHIMSVLPAHPSLTPPFLALVVSGGHTELVVVKDFGRYHVLGRTRDDAAGEAFDKVAKMLDLGYPGGPAVDKLAARGNPRAVPLPRPFLQEGWDFSFSGLKTAVLYHLRDNPGIKGHRKRTADLCASFQAAVVEVLHGKTLAAAEKFDIKNIVVCGGVSANSALREAFEKKAKKAKAHMASPLLCTDNGVMIAVAGYYKWMKGRSKKFVPAAVDADSTLPLVSWA